MRASLIAALALALLLAGCSPEAERTRGDGPGADVGNHTANVDIHGGNYSVWRTPLVRGPGEPR